MRIGEAASQSGLEASAIRFYEKEGVLPPPARTDSGYRDYSADDVDLMVFVRGARSLQIPLDDIREIVDLRTRGRAPCAVVRQALAREASEIEERLEELIVLRDELGRLLALADQVVDDWSVRSCVCHIVESGTVPSLR